MILALPVATGRATGNTGSNGRTLRYYFYCFIFFGVFVFTGSYNNYWVVDATDAADDVDDNGRQQQHERQQQQHISSIHSYLQSGDEALIQEDIATAITQYEQGIHHVNTLLTTSDPLYNNDDDDDDDDLLATMVSIYTNLGTAYSTIGQNDPAIQSYRNAIKLYQKYTQPLQQRRRRSKEKDPDHPSMNDDDNDSNSNNQHYVSASLITAQASFYLGMVFQDIHQPQWAVEAYIYATQLDPQHWSAYSNLGAVYYDQLREYAPAWKAYHQAYTLLVTTDPSSNNNDVVTVTDPPIDATLILSQLQYRIGLCISQLDTTTTTTSTTTTPATTVPHQCVIPGDDPDRTSTNRVGNCNELAAHAFSVAIEYDPNNEAAKHMLATLTADATMHRASNVYVKDLFDQYAHNFEHSLVQELQYTGFERLRRGFDRAFSFNDNTTNTSTTIALPQFDIVVDAGCGTGLVGEQFRNISRTLIGVDLSEAIIAKAMETRPHLYDEVYVGDITTIFQERKGTISLIIAADSFIYFGDLDPLFDAIRVGLQDHNGYIAFTLENVDMDTERVLDTSKPQWRWQLTASGRFAHRKEYVLQTAIDHGLELVHYESMGKYLQFFFGGEWKFPYLYHNWQYLLALPVVLITLLF
jgi:predicted TPR repeat methyltransferase